MKLFLTTILIFLIGSLAIAQSSYQEAVAMGDAAFEKGDYQKAINFYFAVEAFEPDKSIEIKEKVNLVFKKINQLREEANISKLEAVGEKELADARLIQISNLINNIIDLIQSEKTLGILGFSPLKSELLDVLIPANESISNSAKINRPWRNAEIHFQKGSSFDDLCNSIESEKEIQIGLLRII